MITPPLLVSLLLVLGSCRPFGPVAAPPRVGSVAGRPRGWWLVPAGPALLAAMAWTVVVWGAEALSTAASVTPPTVRVAAGVTVAVSAAGQWLWVGRGSMIMTGGGAAGAGASNLGSALFVSSLRGPGRVEVGLTIWSVTLDHGRVAAMGALVAACLLGGIAQRRLAGRVAAAHPLATTATLAWATAALAAGVLVLIDGHLSL